MPTRMEINTTITKIEIILIVFRNKKTCSSASILLQVGKYIYAFTMFLGMQSLMLLDEYHRSTKTYYNGEIDKSYYETNPHVEYQKA